MANFNNIKHEIDQNVNTNGVQAITGAILNETLKDMIDEVDDKKQDTLVAGQNITISGNVISATGGGSGVEYIAGNGIDIDQLGGSVYRISVDASDLAGSGLEVDEFGALKTDPSVVQGKLTAGDGITISQQNEISANIGSGLSIDPQIRCITVNPSDLVDGNGGIMVDNGYIAIDPSVVATQSDLQGYLPLEGGVLQQDSGVDTTLQVIDPDSEDYVKLVAPDSGDNPHIEIFENGSGDTKIYYDKIHSGNWDLNFPTLTQDETIATVSDLNTATSGLQPALTAGDGIEIDANNEISVKAGSGLGFDANGYLINTGGGGGGQTLSAGDGIEIDQNDAINAKLGSGLQLDQNNNIEIDPSVVATQSDLSGYATQTDLQGYLPLTGGNLQASNIATEVRVKSPSDDSYVYLHAVDTGSPTIKFHNDIQNPTNGEVHEITLHNERLDIERWDQSGNTWMADTLYFPQFKTGTIALDSDLAGKQDTLTAGTGITIQNNVISATGGGGSGLWSSGTGTNSLLSPSAAASGATASGTGALNAGYYNGQSGYASYANGNYSANFGTNNKVSYANSFASGLGNTTGGHEAFVGGGASNLAAGDCSAVIGGTFGSANGDNSVVIASGANGTANGNHSVAIGNATASGYGAIAIGEESSTNANHAIAIAGAEATGVNSVAIGKKVGTNNENEIGLGFANKVYTSGTGSIKSAFTVGNGTFSNGNYTYSNGLELKGNSDFYVYGVGGFDGTNSYNGNNSGNRAKTLQEVLNDKQDTLTAGTGISISGNVISATGGSGLWTSGTGTNSLVGPDGGTASGSGSISLNGSSTATKNGAMAGGTRSEATGNYSLAYGNWASATAEGAISLGVHTNANKYGSVALGDYVDTGYKQDGSIALGKYNYVDEGSTATQNTTFSIGNGTGNNARSNALELTAGNKFYMTGVGSYTGANASSATSVQDVINGKQDTLTAGTGISIQGNVISATGGSGNYLPLTGGLLKDTAVGATETLLDVQAPDSTSALSLSADTLAAMIQMSADRDDANVADGTTYGINFDNSGDVDILVKTVNPLDPTDISTTTYTQTFQQKSGTIALLSDISGGGSGLWTSGAGTGSVMSPGATQANGNYSVSGGDGTRANGTGSVALGGNTTASGTYSTALGAGSSATNSYTVAIGHGVQAANQNETALGAFNLYTNSGTSAQKTFFTVGNGTGTNAKSNLIEAKENNDIYVVGVGNYDGTNAGATGVQTLQDAINNGGGSGNYLPLTGGALQADPNDYQQTTLEVWSPDQMALGYIYSYSEDSSDPNNVIPGSAEIGMMGSVPSVADETYEVYHRSNGTILVGYTTDNQGNTDSAEFAFPQKPSGQTYTLATLDDIQGGGGSYLPLSGGTLQQDPNNASRTTLLVESPSQYATAAIETVDLDPGNTSESMAKITLSDYDSSNNQHSATYYSTGIGTGNYQLSFPTLTQNETIATLSDIQGGGSSYTAGTGISISAQNVISNSAPDPGFWVAGDNLGGIRDSRASTCKGADATAIGPGSLVNGYQSTAIAGGQVGNISNAKSMCTAVGSGAYCNANYTTAFGIGTRAFNQYESSVGTYSNSITGGTNAENTQFTIGNGSSNASRSNLLEAKQNNDIYVIGVGGFDGTNAGQSGVETLQTAIANAGGGGASLWTSGSGNDSLLGPGAIGADGDYSIAAGEDSNAQAYNSVALSGGVVVYDDSDPDNIINAEYGVAIGVGSTVESGYSLAMMGGTASAQNGGSHSVAIGDGAIAEGLHDVALAGSSSRGNYSFAASTGIAEGHYSTGLSGGEGNGEGSIASGFGSVAFGYSSAALGLELMTYDQADGTDPTDPNAGEAAFGRYNYSEADIIFSIGCGHHEPPVDPSDGTDVGTDVRENAITITNDGKIYLKGLGGYTGTSVSGCTDLVSFLNNL